MSSQSELHIALTTLMQEQRPLRQVERLVRQQYVEFIRSNSVSDAEAAKKLGLAPSNYHRMCKELGIK